MKSFSIGFLNGFKKRFLFLLVTLGAILLLVFLSVAYMFSPERGRYGAIQVMRGWDDLYNHKDLD